MARRLVCALVFLITTSQALLAQQIWSEMRADDVVVDGSDAETAWTALASLKPEERRARFEAAPPELKSGLWRVHLRTFMSEHPDLSSEQRQLLAAAIELASPRLFVRPLEAGDGEIVAKLDDLSDRARAIFSRDLGAAAFGRLGPPYRARRDVKAHAGDGEEPPVDDGNPPTMGGLRMQRVG